MKKLLISVGLAVVLGGMGGAGVAMAAPPTEPPSPNASHACVYHGPPETVGFPNAPFCPL